MSELNLELIGSIMKYQRQKLEFSIRDLSEKSGVSSGTISQIETGKTAPNIASLYSLCKVLNYPIASLFSDTPDSRVEHTKKEDRKVFIRNNSSGKPIEEELLINGAKEMWSAVIITPSHTDSGNYYTHEGEELIYVLEGELTFMLQGYKEFHLKAGDTLYYPNYIGHRWVNDSDKEVKFILTSTTRFINDPS